MDGIYQHFRPEEASVIDSLNEVIVRAKDEYRPILTHFLNEISFIDYFCDSKMAAR